jgi:response regulator RpfG family c-di-GMP phosphodiesterase
VPVPLANDGRRQNPAQQRRRLDHAYPDADAALMTHTDVDLVIRAMREAGYSETKVVQQLALMSPELIEIGAMLVRCVESIERKLDSLEEKLNEVDPALQHSISAVDRLKAKLDRFGPDLHETTSDAWRREALALAGRTLDRSER